MLRLVISEQFALDVEVLKNTGRDLEQLKLIIEKIVHQQPLSVYCCHNPVPHTWGRWDCKISFDWWLYYKYDANSGTVTFERTGGVKELYGE